VITLNSDRGLVQIEDWLDIESRPGFSKNLDPTAHKLKAIIGRYVFPERIRCGLSNCHTPHAKGYIVVTEDGRETNIGKDCGKTYFGVDFEVLSRRFDEDLAASQNRESLATFSFQLEELEARIKTLRASEHGADWVHKHTRELISVGRTCPEGVVRRIVGMIRSRNPEVTVERLATEEEVQEIETRERREVPRPHYLTDIVGRIAGIEALYSENDLRELLVIDLQTRIGEFRDLTITSLTHVELRRWAKWIATVENTLARANAAVAFGQLLLCPDGLNPLLSALPAAEQRQFRAYMRILQT
jgi:hypothetical protein